MKHIYYDQCLTVDPSKENGKLLLATCDEETNPNQRWHFEQAMLT